VSDVTLKGVAQQVEQLTVEDKLALLTVLAESLQRQVRSQPRPLSAYYGLGAGQGFKSAAEADAFIREERSGWEQ
jgi:hypothetical protein